MKIIAIDNILCIKCRDCIDECPKNLFYSPPTKIGEKRKVFFEDPNHECTFCGQCIDICPTKAIQIQIKD